MKKEKLNPSNFTSKTGAYSQGMAITHGGLKWIYVTGQIAMDADGNVVCPNDVAGQAEYIFSNIATILSEAGASLDDVVKAQIFLTDISKFAEVSAIRNKYFAQSEPVSTLVEVSSLVKSECMIEIEVTAVMEEAKE